MQSPPLTAPSGQPKNRVRAAAGTSPLIPELRAPQRSYPRCIPSVDIDPRLTRPCVSLNPRRCRCRSRCRQPRDAARPAAAPPPSHPTAAGSRPRTILLVLGPRSQGGRGRLALLGVDDVHDRVDQRQVGEGLREVAQVAPGLRIDLLAVQVERAGEGEQPLAQAARPLELADLDQRRYQPEGADGEGALPAGQAVIGLAPSGSAAPGRPRSARWRWLESCSRSARRPAAGSGPAAAAGGRRPAHRTRSAG